MSKTICPTCGKPMRWFVCPLCEERNKEDGMAGKTCGLCGKARGWYSCKECVEKLLRK